ncbi:hypothetical protein BS47DRAFT_1369603 [Hydnum rufescens UP504]|uniref:Uncharacterized protein n=1 Tax=Hydnum rufescens UP504 TaxID=1448309 RepID=A0A9P6ADH2_9AGAM|nr:hypothetical protein BS47DRAFT_1369603 [Hydnum rufescens UP504]
MTRRKMRSTNDKVPNEEIKGCQTVGTPHPLLQVIASTTCQMNPPPPEMTTNPPNEGHKHDLHRKQLPNKTQKWGCTMQGPGTPDEPHTHFSRCVIMVQQSPPRNATYERNPPKPQSNEARPPAVHQTKPQRKTTGNTDGTTHLLKQVPSLCENPPDKHPDEPAVCAATQARNSQPLNTTIDNIAHHTPAAAVCDLDPTPTTLPNEHGRMTTRPPNESQERQ